MHAYYREVTHDDVEIIQAFSKAQKKYYYYVGINKYGIKCKLSPWYDTRRKPLTQCLINDIKNLSLL